MCDKRSYATARPAQSTAVHHAPTTIRRATIADVKTISDMGRRLLPAAHAGAFPAGDLNLYLRQAFEPDRVRSEICDPAACFWLARRGERVAGMVKMRAAHSPLDGLGNRPVELSRLYLETRFIGRGVGSALMEHALATAAAEGHDLCWLLVWTGNERAERFYQRWNFRVVEQRRYPVGRTRLPVYLMARDMVRVPHQ